MNKLKKIAGAFQQYYALDLRALALMRIGIGLVVLCDLLIRASDLTAHYTNDGIWPSHLIYNFGWRPGYWSLHALIGSFEWEVGLFILHFISALFLLVGYKTKISTILVWLFTISLHNRNLFIQQSGDDLLRLILFWGMFLPWHSSYSLDARRPAHLPQQKTIANLGYLLLIASVYFFSACLKTGVEWHNEGSAIYYALSLEQLRLPFTGDLLYRFPELMKLLTWLVYYIELLIPFLVLFPVRSPTLRFTAFVFIVVLQAGIGSTLYVGLFFVIGMVSAIGLLPAWLIDKIERKIKIRSTPIEGHYKKELLGGLPSNIIIGIMILLCLTINFGAVKWFPWQLRHELWLPVNILRFDQYWGMFSPSILKKDGWFVYHGIDARGQHWDLRLAQKDVDYRKPDHIVSMYKSDRWRKLAENIQSDNNTFLRPLYCNYILRQWNLAHPEKKMATLNLYFMEKESLANYKTTKLKKNLLSVCNEH